MTTMACYLLAHMHHMRAHEIVTLLSTLSFTLGVVHVKKLHILPCPLSYSLRSMLP
jgi:hypothetical protein